ncbi:MAG: CDP-alcohol phosphatidyltransferase family protein [Candidatus Dojkabacteria bacterium]|nr:CDP-alcohol phosphatidyltransferase family protein [Candidatus Dojkabacteria bacterium]
MYFYSQGNSLLGSLFVVGALFDAIDGTVARLTGKFSQFGGVLDATIDRITEGMVLLSIGAGRLAPWELVFTIFIGSISISYIKAKAEAASGTSKVGKNQFSVGIGQRGDRILILFVGSILNYFFSKDDNKILFASLIILLISIVITLVWRGIMIWKVLEKQDLNS